MEECTIENVGFGCTSLTTHAFLRDAMSVLETACDVGIRHFDTAPLYGRGYSEEVLGRFLRSREDLSASVTVATKFTKDYPNKLLPTKFVLLANGCRRRWAEFRSRISDQRGRPAPHVADCPAEGWVMDCPTEPKITRRDIEKSFAASSRALGRDRIDYFLLHDSRPAALEREAFSWVCKMRDAGSIGKLGVASNYQLISNLSASELEGWDVLQYEFVPEVSLVIAAMFPEKIHILHSCMKWLGTPLQNKGKLDSPQNLFGYVVSELNCRYVLFSTRDAARLRRNVTGLGKPREGFK